MRRKFLTLAVVIGSLALGACQDDTMDDLIAETELTTEVDPDDDPDRFPN